MSFEFLFLWIVFYPVIIHFSSRNMVNFQVCVLTESDYELKKKQFILLFYYTLKYGCISG